MSRKLESAALVQQTEDVDSILREVCALVSRIAGIQLGERQFTMVESRLRIRMLKLGIDSLQNYVQYLREHLDEESVSLLSLLTTHHTYFFREFSHFEYILNELFPSLIDKARARADKTIHLWSAACSRGQEVYSLAMFMKYHLSKSAPDVKFELWGSDVDPESVSIAKNGVYLYKELVQVPAMYMENHWARGSGEISEYVKAKGSLKSHCHFTVINLISDTQAPKNIKFDLIFCRNVFIYFNNEQIKRVVDYLGNHLETEGHLFVGISETLAGLDVKLESVGPSVYVKKNALKAAENIPAQKQEPASRHDHAVRPALLAQKPIRVLCVDDSPSIHTLLKKVLSAENGFQIIGHAMNGKEAVEIAKTQSFDVMTLDIHMPVMDGLQYLSTQLSGKKHPPVVMLSSVQRENADMALKALELGASDYIEKPNLSNLMERGDEIRAKIKTVLMASQSDLQKSMELQRSFSKKFKITHPEKKLRILIGSLGDFERIKSLFLKSSDEEPGFLFLIDGAKEAVEVVKGKLSRHGRSLAGSCQLRPGEVGVFELSEVRTEVEGLIKNRKCSLLVCGVPTQRIKSFVLNLGEVHLVLEDLGHTYEESQKDLHEVAAASAPATSFMSLSEEFLQ